MFRMHKVLALVLFVCISIPTAVFGAEVTSGIAEVNGTKLFYEMKGKGEAIVFIHSGGFDRRVWDDQFNTFSEHYKVVRYDVRGYGKSIPPTKPYSDEEDLYQLLKFLNIPKAHVVGMSMGGRIAIDFTITHPEMVASLIPVSSAVSGYPFSAQDLMEILKVVYAIQNDDVSFAGAGEAWLQSAYNAPAMEHPEIAKRLRPIAMENARAWLINPLFPRPPFPPAMSRLAEIHAPTLVILGERDISTIKAIAQALETGIPGAKKVVIPGAGHVVSMEKPEEFNSAVLDFLNKR